jgi:hypothetical protein
MTSLRRASERFASAWRRSAGRDRLMIAACAVVSAVLAGMFLFGAWHVLFGGLVRGNPRAAAFGVALAAVSGLALAVVGLLGRRATEGEEDAPQAVPDGTP